MKHVLKISATIFIMALACMVYAQNNDAEKLQKNENIIIRKNGDSKEKLTIVIDSDKVMVNGKPLDEFKNDNVEILKDENTDEPFLTPPHPPVPPTGGIKMFENDYLKSNSAFLGVMTEKVTDGVKITDITKGSAAEKAGLQRDDIITKISDTKIKSSEDLYKTIGTYKPDDKVNITFKRNDKDNTVTVTLQKNKNTAFNFNKDFNFNTLPELQRLHGFEFGFNNKPRLGAEVQDTEDGTGVKILNVDDDAPAAKAGLKEGDIITQINGKPVKSVDDIKDVLKNLKQGDIFTLQYKRDNKFQSAEIKIPKELKTTDL